MPYIFLAIVILSCQSAKKIAYEWKPTQLTYSGKAGPSILKLNDYPPLEFSAGSEILWIEERALVIKSVDNRQGAVLTEQMELIDLMTAKRNLIVGNIVWHSDTQENTLLATLRRYKSNEERKDYYSAPKNLVKIVFSEKLDKVKIIDLGEHECLPDLGELELNGKILVKCPPNYKSILNSFNYGD